MSTWAGPRKRNHVYEGKGYRQEVGAGYRPLATGKEGPTDAELRKAEAQVERYFWLLGDWLRLKALPSVPPGEESWKRSLDAFLAREWKKFTPRAKDIIRRRLKAALEG